MHFGFGAEAEEVMNRDWAPSASSSLPATAPDGGRYAFSDRYFVPHLPDCDVLFTKILRKAIPLRYRIAVLSISFTCSSATNRLIMRMHN
jgi:hypothetical protein